MRTPFSRNYICFDYNFSLLFASTTNTTTMHSLCQIVLLLLMVGYLVLTCINYFLVCCAQVDRVSIYWLVAGCSLAPHDLRLSKLR